METWEGWPSKRSSEAAQGVCLDGHGASHSESSLIHDPDCRPYGRGAWIGRDEDGAICVGGRGRDVTTASEQDGAGWTGCGRRNERVARCIRRGGHRRSRDSVAPCGTSWPLWPGRSSRAGGPCRTRCAVCTRRAGRALRSFRAGVPLRSGGTSRPCRADRPLGTRRPTRPCGARASAGPSWTGWTRRPGLPDGSRRPAPPALIPDDEPFSATTGTAAHKPQRAGLRAVAGAKVPTRIRDSWRRWTCSCHGDDFGRYRERNEEQQWRGCTKTTRIFPGVNDSPLHKRPYSARFRPTRGLGRGNAAMCAFARAGLKPDTARNCTPVPD
jgi:hypothetical protein